MIVEADHLYAADFRWWFVHHKDIACGFTGKKWSCDPPRNTNWSKGAPAEYGVTVLNARIADKGLSSDKGAVVTGGNSGYQAINLAYHLGGTRIILLGFDMTWTNGKAHWFGNHPKGLTNAKPDKYIAAFRTIKPEDYGIEILNCSRETALDAFPRHRLDDVL